MKSETKLEMILWSIECGFETWVLEIESLSKSRLRLKIPKRFEIPQKLILEGWRLSGMSRVSLYIWEEFDETGHNIRVKLSHMHILDILEDPRDPRVRKSCNIFVSNVVELLNDMLNC